MNNGRLLVFPFFDIRFSFIHSLSLSPFLLFTHINANANAKDFDEWIYSLMLVVYIHTSFGFPLPVSSSSHLFSPSPLFSLYDYVCIASHVYVPSHTYNPYGHNNIFNVFFNLKISIFLLSFFLPLFFYKNNDTDQTDLVD